MEHRVDNVGYYEQMSGQPYTVEEFSRLCGNPVNTDGKVSIEELTNIIRTVTAALSQK